MTALETNVRTRTGARGVNSTAAGGLVVASFTHFSSSAGDPRLHKHLLINATTPGPDGKWRTIDSRMFFASKRIAEAAAMVAMPDFSIRAWASTGPRGTCDCGGCSPRRSAVSSI